MLLSALVMDPLIVLSKLYAMLVRTRNALYSSGWLQVHRLQRPVISVGNVTLGGTGKTPTVIALGRHLQRQGYRVSVLLRGYKGSHRGGPLLVSDGASCFADSAIAGDEAIVIAKNLPGACVTVGRDRAKAGAWIEDREAVDVHLLDDGFQHRRLHRDLDLVLVDSTDSLEGDALVPAGRLREPLDELSRAHAVILTRTEPGLNYTSLIAEIHGIKPELPCFLARQQVVLPSVAAETGARGELSLPKANVVAFAGLGHPEQFFSTLRRQGVSIVGTLTFPDHHRYRGSDLMRIRQACSRAGVTKVITTEKDAENLDGYGLHPLNVIVARVVFEFEDSGIFRLISETLEARGR